MNKITKKKKKKEFCLETFDVEFKIWKFKLG